MHNSTKTYSMQPDDFTGEKNPEDTSLDTSYHSVANPLSCLRTYSTLVDGLGIRLRDLEDWVQQLCQASRIRIAGLEYCGSSG